MWPCAWARAALAAEAWVDDIRESKAAIGAHEVVAAVASNRSALASAKATIAESMLAVAIACTVCVHHTGCAAHAVLPTLCAPEQLVARHLAAIAGISIVADAYTRGVLSTNTNATPRPILLMHPAFGVTFTCIPITPANKACAPAYALVCFADICAPLLAMCIPASVCGLMSAEIRQLSAVTGRRVVTAWIDMVFHGAIGASVAPDALASSLQAHTGV